MNVRDCKTDKQNWTEVAQPVWFLVAVFFVIFVAPFLKCCHPISKNNIWKTRSFIHGTTVLLLFMMSHYNRLITKLKSRN